jgi:hypothetical protein
MILPCFYNAPISLYALIMQQEGEVMIEQLDHYSKQTYRNRCRILGANGVINLVIPVVRKHSAKILMKDVRIDYDTSWHKIHWKSIFSAYASAPFFEYFYDSFTRFYEKRFVYLRDLNFELMQTTLTILEKPVTISRTENYIPLNNEYDVRESVHPKRAFHHGAYSFTPYKYHQVFSMRHGFIEDLSILDLLFNEGPNANMILLKSLSIQ